MIAKYSEDRHECVFYDHFANQDEPMITDGCISNYLFSTTLYSYDVNPIFSSYYEHYSQKEILMIDDQDLIIREEECHQFFRREAVIFEQGFFVDQHVFDLGFKDLMASFMDSYFSENLKISDLLRLPLFMGKYGFLKKFLSLLLHVKHHLLISDKDEISSVFKLFGWLLWKSTFT